MVRLHQELGSIELVEDAGPVTCGESSEAVGAGITGQGQNAEVHMSIGVIKGGFLDPFLNPRVPFPPTLLQGLIPRSRPIPYFATGRNYSFFASRFDRMSLKNGSGAPAVSSSRG